MYWVVAYGMFVFPIVLCPQEGTPVTVAYPAVPRPFAPLFLSQSSSARDRVQRHRVQRRRDRQTGTPPSSKRLVLHCRVLHCGTLLFSLLRCLCWRMNREKTLRPTDTYKKKTKRWDWVGVTFCLMTLYLLISGGRELKTEKRCVRRKGNDR